MHRNQIRTGKGWEPVFWGVTLVALFALTPAPALSESPEDAALAARIHEATSQLAAPDGSIQTVSEAMAELGLHGLSVAVIEDYEISWIRQWGVRAAGQPEAIDSETSFSLASMSKPITAVLIAILAEKGLIELDVPVAGYLERWSIPTNHFTEEVEVTLTHLLTHMAGTTQHGFKDFYRDGPVATLVQSLNGDEVAGTDPLEVTAVPGTDWRYSGGGYVIAQMAVEDHLGRSLSDLAAEHLFVPLGLKHTTMKQDGEAGFPANVAQVHDHNGERVGSGIPICPQLSASGVWSTPSDMAVFVIAMQRALRGDSGGVISPAVARRTTDIETARGMGGWSLGWGRNRLWGNREWFSHGGSNTGTGGHIRGSMEEGMGIALLGNGPSNIREPMMTMIWDSIRQAHGWSKPLTLESGPLPIDPELVEKVSGRYSPDGGGAFEVVARDGKLFAEGFLGSEPSELIRVRENAFVIDEFHSEIRFLPRPSDGKLCMTTTRAGDDEVKYVFSALWSPPVMPEEYMRKGDYAAALTAYKSLLAVQPTDPACAEATLNSRAYEEAMSGNLEGALQTLFIYVELYPESSNAYDSLGEIYMMTGNDELAIVNYERSLALDAGNSNAVQMLEQIRSR